MTTFTMHFGLPRRVPRGTNGRGQRMLRATRRLAGRLGALHNMTPQDRADHYVANMPIAVLAR